MGKNKHNTDTTETENAKRLRKIDKALRDPDLKKKARKALEAERAELVIAVEVESKPKSKGKKKDKAPKPVEASTPPEDATDADEEARKAHVAARKLLEAHGHPGQPAVEDIDRDNEELVAAYNLTVGKLTGHFATSNAEVERRVTALHTDIEETTASIKARVEAKRAARAEGDASPTATDDAKPKGKKKGKADPVEDWTDPEPYYIAEDESRHSVETYKSWDDSSTQANLAFLKPRTREEYEADQAKATKAVAVVDQEDGPTLVMTDPEEGQPRDRWDRPIIQPVGGGKGTGYRRTTTFIDVLDDKSALIDWGRRIVVTGVAAIEQKIAGDEELVNVDEVGVNSVIERVIAANETLAASAKKADKALAKGKIDADQHAADHDAAERAHKDALNALVQEAFKAGDGFTKAETGTRIHKLTEIWDTEGAAGLKALGDVTASEFRDIEAYAAACAKLNVEVLAVEQFVVVDELKVGGTLDRRLRYDSPSLGRRITAIGDVKTGRVDYGMGKMTRQLAIYAKGKGYDWRKPEERVTYRTNQEVGLIFHLPAGSGVCEVWEIDLKKGWEGVQLCAKVFAHRTETTQAKVGSKIATSVEDAA